MASPTDIELLEQWRTGSTTAADTLVKRYFPEIRTYFLTKFSNEHEELVQETFKRLAEGRDAFRGEASFKTYLFKIAQYVGHEHLRERYRNGQRFEPASSSIADLTGRRQSSILAEREDYRLLLDATRRLPFAQQELLEHYYWQRLTAKEIAALNEIPESTVRSRIRLALQRLAKIFAELSNKEHARELTEDEVERWFDEVRDEIGRATVRSD